ncbi:MAG: hypothetical protein ACYC1E_09625 [Propionibacteriaceae bacterium]
MGRAGVGEGGPAGHLAAPPYVGVRPCRHRARHLTPFRSCRTTPIVLGARLVLGALASSVPWAPIVAFMASSPLTSPEEYVLSVGLFGPAFAMTFFVSAIVVGLVAGAAAW